MRYKNYEGSVRYNAEDRILHGRVAGIRDAIIFDGASVETLEKNFQGAVDEYLAFRKAECRKPNTPVYWELEAAAEI